MLSVQIDTKKPNRYHLWSEAESRYLLRGVRLQQIRDKVRADAVAYADQAVDDMLADVATGPH